jgi:hypothetical protein
VNFARHLRKLLFFNVKVAFWRPGGYDIARHYRVASEFSGEFPRCFG